MIKTFLERSTILKIEQVAADRKISFADAVSFLLEKVLTPNAAASFCPKGFNTSPTVRPVWEWTSAAGRSERKRVCNPRDCVAGVCGEPCERKEAR